MSENPNHIDLELVKQWAATTDRKLETDCELVEPFEMRAACREILRLRHLLDKAQGGGK